MFVLVADLAQVSTASLAERKARVVIIGCAKPKFIAAFKSSLRIPFDVYADPDRSVYLALGLKHDKSLVRISGQSAHVKSGFTMGIFKAIGVGLKSLQMQGDVYQQGGAFVFRGPQTLLYSHVDGSPMDHAPINDVLAVCGVESLALPHLVKA